MSINKGDHKAADNIALGDATSKGDFEDAASVRAYLADADELEAAVQADAVFGEINEEGPNYKNVSLAGTVMLMVKAQVSSLGETGRMVADSSGCRSVLVFCRFRQFSRQWVSCPVSFCSCSLVV
jgi:hypothetical protein